MLITLIVIATITCIFYLLYRLIYVHRELKEIRKVLTASELQLLKETERQKNLSTELTELKEKFIHDVLYDSLTELPARRVFEDRLSQTINQAKRYQLSFAVLCLDIDGFKIINDALGYELGDQLLKEVAIRIQNSIRTVDTASRFGSDEFGIILSQLSKPESAAYVGKRLLESLSQPFKVQTQEVFLTASIGIATYPLDGEEGKTLIKNADTALHQAKTRGNTYHFYRADMHAHSQREIILSTSLQHAGTLNDFTIFYQPEVNTKTKKIVSMESLLFWQHQDFGLIPLQDFLRLAENAGKMMDIGEWLLRHTFEQYLKWQTEGLLFDSVAVTVSSRQLDNPHFAYRLSRLLQEMHVDPSQLVLEVSETTLLTKLDLIEKVLHMLKHIGVRIAIKDFGEGQLSLLHLKRFPIDSLVIAPSLVRTITVNKDSESIIKMIIAIAKSAHLAISADGVETERQKNQLIELGCYIMQGPYFSAPLSASELSREKIDSICQ